MLDLIRFLALKICKSSKFYAKNIWTMINFVILALKLVQLLVFVLFRLERTDQKTYQ